MPQANKQFRHSAKSKLIGLGVFALSLFILWKAVPHPAFERTIWTAQGQTPVPGTFSYAMFPRQTHLKLYDQPNGLAASSLDHPTICTERERASGGFLPVRTTQGVLYANLSDLTFTPTNESGTPVESLVFRSTDETQRIALSQRLASAGVQSFVLRTDDRKHPRERVYVWDVASGVPTPREIRQSDMATALNFYLFTAGIVVVSLVLGMMASNIFNRRARRTNRTIASW